MVGLQAVAWGKLKWLFYPLAFTNGEISKRIEPVARPCTDSLAKGQLMNAQVPLDFDALAQARRSCRAYLSKGVSRELIQALLSSAARAPSGSNIQPWKVYVLQGASLSALSQKVSQAHDALRDNPSLAQSFEPPYRYYPDQWFAPYKARRLENGLGLYQILGIAREEKDKMHVQHQKNFRFFDAPVGLLFTIDRRLQTGSFLDYGMFLQTLMLAAQAKGLGTCVQAAWVRYHSVVMPHLNATEQEMLVCGMAMGWPDLNDQVNDYATPRVSVDDFTEWLTE